MSNWIKNLGDFIKMIFQSFASSLFPVKKTTKTTTTTTKTSSTTQPTFTEIGTTITEQILQFIKGEPYSANSPIVQKLRELIGDEFGLGRSGDYLNCTEYVQFRVKEKLGVHINWPLDRPRNGGKWASIFDRNNLYKTIDSPRINCAISFTTGISSNPVTNDIGHVAFVEKVNDDFSVEISEANWPNQGKYNERRLEPWQWQDKYKCRFIDFL